MADQEPKKPQKMERVLFGNASQSEEELVAAFGKWFTETQERLRKVREEKAKAQGTEQESE